MKHINLIQMLQGCSKRNGMTVSASMHDDGHNCNVKQRAELMSEDEKWSENGALSSTCLRSASVPLSFRSRYLRYAAMIFCVLVMSIGQAWADTELSFSPTAKTVTSGSVSVRSTNTTPSQLNPSKTNGWKVDSNPLRISSTSANITKIVFTGVTNSSGSGSEVGGQVQVSADSTSFAKLTSGFSFKDALNSSLTSTDGISMNKYGSASYSVTLEFSSPQRYIHICKASSNGKQLNIFSITVYTSGGSSKKIYLKNSMGWATAYVTRLGTTSYWDGTNGSGSNGRNGTYAMTYDSAKKLFYYDAPSGANDTYLCFTKDNQQNYNNFHNTEAVYVNGGYAFGKVIWVGTNTTFTKNGTKYYGNEDHSGVNKEDYSEDVFLCGTYNEWVKNNDAKFTAGTPFTKTVSLTAGTVYKFKVVDNAWFGQDNVWVMDDKSGLTFSQTGADLNLLAPITGDYTFTYNRSTHAVTVTYPTHTHPHSGYVYIIKYDWTNAYLHAWYDNTHPMTTWGSDLQLSHYVDICGTEYWCIPVLSYYSNFIVKDNAGDPSNTTGDQSFTSHGKQNMYHNGSSWGWHDFTTYTISFAGNGNTGGSMSAITDICSNSSQAITANAFEKTGYTFNCWHADKAVKVSGSTIPAGGDIAGGATLQEINNNITLTAQWSPEQYDVTTSLTNVTVSSGTTGTDAATYNTAYSVTFAGSTGYNLPAAVTVMRGSTNITANCTWTQGTGVLTIPAAQVTGNISISATGVAKTTAITLEAGDGGTDGSATATYGTSTITDYEPATRTGYTLGNYYRDGSKNNILTKEGELNSGDKGSILDDGLWVYDGATITLYAQWSVIEYPIEYDLAGGNVASPNPTSYTIESEAITLNNPTKTGYTFAGWTGTGLAEATTTVTIAAGSTGNRSYTATWTAIVPSSVSLNKSSTTITVGGTETLTATISPAVVADNTITWTSSDGTVATVTSVGVVTGVKAGTATITATTVNDKAATCEVTVAAAVTYTVTYEYNGATSGASPASATGASVSLPNPTKTGYTLQGWYTSSGALAGAATATYNPTSNITLYALWRESCAGGGGNKTLVDINFKDASWSGKTFSQVNDNNEDLINGVYFWSKEASKHFSLADNTSNGLTFPNNNMSSGNYYFCIPITGINSSDKQITVTLKHGYSSNKASYKYVYIDGRTTFVDGNTNGSGGESVSDAANADTQMSFTKGSLSNTSGHLIIGRNSSSYTQIYGVTVTTPGNATCYYVTYNGNGATGGFMTDETAHGSGDNVAILANTYTREGYTFTGWKTEPSSGTSYEPEGTITGISSNITLYAQWSAGTLYSVTYNGNGATSGSVPVDASSPYASGSNVTVLGNTGTLALANYTFDGWATANDGTGTSYTAGGTISSIAADVELFAKWKQTVTLNTGSQGSEEEKTPYIYINGAALNGFSAHSAAGYTLNGYYTAPTGGTKVLNADGSFAAAAVTNYITVGKWSRTDATTLYAQWRAAAGSTCYEWDATVTKPQTGTNVNFGGLYLTATNKTKVSFYSGQAADSCYDISAKAKTLYGHLNGTEIASVKFAASTNNTSYTTVFIAFCSSTTFDVENIIQVGGYDATVYTVNKNDAAKSEFTVSAPAGTKSFAIGRNMDGLTYSSELQIGQNRYLYYLYVCSASGGTHTISYNAGGGTGTMSSNTGITDDGSQMLTANGFTAPTNYSFAGWVADGAVTIGGDVKTAGTLIADGATITNITVDIALTAKWTQSITLNANTSNHGTGDNTSATVMYNATALSSISHTSAESGYKLTGYFTEATAGTKVLNSDGTFAGNNIDGWISDGKWTCVASTRTLYAQYEAAGALIWNLGVNTDATSLTTSSKTSAFTQIAVANMGDATLSGSTYTKSAKSSLTGKISSPATKSDYVYVTFKVADGYKFTPSNISVKVQPVGNGEHKNVELLLTDESFHSLASASATKCDGTTSGKTTTVSLAGNSTFFTGNVTLKIYVYDFSGSATGTYRLGTPITIEGEIEETCATMPSYTSMSYTTTTFAPNASALGSPITIVGGENIDTYQWKYNTTNDRTSGTECGSNEASLVPLTNAEAATDGTRYYWCEMTNTECDITIKSPAVAITVVAAKSNATVSWTGTTASANYGGGGYTVTATISTAEWDGTLTEGMLTAMDGVVLSNINVTNDGKTITANFGVTEGTNAEATNVEFYLNHPVTTDYNAIDETYNTTTLVTSCITGGGDGSSYDVRVRKNTTTILQGKSTVYGWDTPTKGFVTQNTGGSVTSTKSDYDDEPVFDSISKGNAKAYWVKSYVANVKKIRVYGQVGDDDLTATGVYHVGSFVAGGSSTAVAYSVIYEDEVDALKKGNHWFEITLDEAISTNDIIYFTVNKNFKIMGVRLTTVGAGGATLATALSAWSPAIDTRKEVYEDAASFIETVTKTGANANTMGAITYSSGDETIATVDNRTGRVTIANSITWGDAITYKDVTITASLAPSGCYQGKTATYTLRVNKLTCTEAAGTITASSEGSHVVIEGDEVKKCTEETVTLTLGGYEEGATSFQWYKDGVLQDGKTTASITTADAGVWYAVSNKECDVTSTNEITITNRSTSAHVTRLVKEWYIKHGRLTPDIALWELGDDCSFVSVAASDGWDAGTDLTEEGIFYEQDGIVYMKGTDPLTNTGAQQNYTLTLTVNDGCSNQTLDADGKIITIHHQQNTDKHVLAFIVSGTDKGDWTAGVTADQTTNVGLYNAIAANFDVLATNSRSTDDEQKLKEYYSQFDILCITDYPNTGDKGANKKSYVDALGALIDIRPILTMEAWVSKLANWKAKGISGNPKNPSTRQYTMDLQCKDHEIFAGTNLTKVGEGDEAMYRVSMVDNTKEDYATLDATYGDGAHADKSGYEYASKPALQGFTFTEDMADDLLPIGLIDDGAGNPLQVGIERQRNMEARLMVLGINSYAMERLTDDGEQVVINALNYLMKKNAEDIADCSIYFTGGDEEEDEATRYNWNVDSHWSNGTQPISTQKVRILAKCVIPSGVRVHVTDVLIVPDGPINHGVDVAKGSLTIEAGGALIVDGKVEATTAPNYFHPHATSAENLVLKTSSSAQAALIFDNEEAETQATVKLYSLGKKPSNYEYQYFAVPMEVVPVNPAFANETHGGTGIYTYVYDEASSGWTRRKYYDDLFAFEGLGITTKSTGAMNYTMTGNLASTATKEITLTHDGAGLNLIGNSWMAPIQIAALAEDNTDANITKTAYIYCAGRDAEGGAQIGDVSTEPAGQWIAIPFEASGTAGWRDAGKLSVIPAMQAFEINVSAEATLTLDYDKVVRGSTNDLNAKLRAPGRRMAANEVTMTNIRVADSKTHTDLSLFEGDSFSEAFDNGWEAEYMNGDGRSAKLYAETESGQMAVAAMYDYEGTVVGFAPGQETEYTFSFMGEDNGYYLNDIKLHNSVRISEGETYTFTYEEGDAANRFYISRTAINAPEVPTGMENLDAAAPRVQKIIYNDKLYIIRGGRLYDATGKVVK